MGLMDKLSGSDAMRDRYEELKTQAQNGDLTDEKRDEFEKLRTHFERHDTQ